MAHTIVTIAGSLRKQSFTLKIATRWQSSRRLRLRST